MPRQRRRGRRGRWIKRQVFWGLIALLLALGASQLVRPAATVREQSERMATLGVTRSALAMEKADLEAYRAFLATEAGQETAARRQGYLRPGERRVIFFREEVEEEMSAAEPKREPQP